MATSVPPKVESDRSTAITGPCRLICMQSTTVRIDAATHEDLKRLAQQAEAAQGEGDLGTALVAWRRA